MNAKPLLLIPLLALCAGLTAPASARSPQPRQITGTIRKVDAPAREVEMLREDKGTLLNFVWNKHTAFIANAQFTAAGILKKGARVEINCHTPFFGKPFVTKVTLLQTHNQK